MKVLRAGSHRVMPWKNGGGSTTEIAVFPDGAGFDTFDWRVSMATVAADGPFSSFSDIDRTLAVLSGAGLRLTIDGRAPVSLTGADAPLAFPGDVSTHGALIDGPIVDLNVMSRRGRVGHRMTRHGRMEPLDIAMDGAVNLIVSRSDDVTLTCGQRSLRLATDDAVLISQPATVRIAPDAGREMSVFAISFMPAQSA